MRPKIHATGNTLRIRSQNGMIGSGDGRFLYFENVMIGVRTTGDVHLVADALASITEVDYVVITAGGFDLLCEVVCEDDDHLLEVLNQKIRTLPGVRTTETFVYLKLRKQLYNWGTR